MKHTNFSSFGILLALAGPAIAADAPPVVVPPVAAATPAGLPTDVPGVDFSKLSEAQKKLAITIMNEEKCNCGCNYTLVGCRTKDQKCPISPGLAQNVVTDILAGKSEADIRKGLAPKAAPPPPPPLDTKVNTIDYTDLPSKGPKNAKVVLAEVSDFQCPFCAQAQPWIKDIMAAYPNDVRVVFKQFPLVSIHEHAMTAAQASLAANAQGKFWEMHDKLFENFRQLSPDKVKEIAKEIGLDTAKFNKDLDAGTYKARVEKEMKEGEAMGVQGTPSFFLNGRKYSGGRDIASVKKAIDEIKNGPAPPAKTEAKTDAKAGTAEPKKAGAKPGAQKPDDAKPAEKKSGSDQ